VATLVGERNLNIHYVDAFAPPGVVFIKIDPVAEPCYLATKAPPAPWVVAPITSGKRPAYLINPDGTRGKQQGTADVMLVGTAGPVPMWCQCGDSKRRIVTSSSTYCPWATQQ